MSNYNPRHSQLPVVVPRSADIEMLGFASLMWISETRIELYPELKLRTVAWGVRFKHHISFIGFHVPEKVACLLGERLSLLLLPIIKLLLFRTNPALYIFLTPPTLHSSYRILISSVIWGTAPANAISKCLSPTAWIWKLSRIAK